ncbi:MAG: UDP-N-acetylglucosamine 2-epimerase (non-hydrolyzing) [Firmicutes bacterium]|nr:UDP-N-acetylglucosamine 2-epimerase (non-hydrolyzing) [Bacillota bacterium]
MRPGAVKICIVVGTRPEAIKMAPVILSLTGQAEFTIKTIVTAQHREMLDQVLQVFRIRPEYDLNIMSRHQSLVEISCRILDGITPILKTESPDLLMVHGDTTTTFTASLAAFYQKIKVAHVEAGLRTRDKWRPYPEEINRVLTGKIADLHFAPTDLARQNLLAENVPSESIFVTGNTVIDALNICLAGIPKPGPAMKCFILVSAHRRENWGPPLQKIINALQGILADNPEIHLLIPVHLNPLVQESFTAAFQGEPRVKLVKPLDYREMVQAMAAAHLIITDSGGLQEEAPSLGKPVLVLRDKTERPEAVAAGTVKLVGTDPETIRRETNELLHNPLEYQKMSRAVNPYGDGKAAQRITAGLRYYFGLTQEKPEEFLVNPKEIGN